MEAKYLILSDIHGNVSAFDAVLNDCREENFNGVIILGDCIDYGMRSNEIIQKINMLENTGWNILVNIRGNHEKLVMDQDLERLSSDRGRVMAQYTLSHLSSDSENYIRSKMEGSGSHEFLLDGFRCLAVHGSLEDHFWKAIDPDNLRGDYSIYDIVFSGHSHYSLCFTHF